MEKYIQQYRQEPESKRSSWGTTSTDWGWSLCMLSNIRGESIRVLVASSLNSWKNIHICMWRPITEYETYGRCHKLILYTLYSIRSAKCARYVVSLSSIYNTSWILINQIRYLKAIYPSINIFLNLKPQLW